MTLVLRALPAPSSRMTPGRKAWIVAAVEHGLIPRATVLTHYAMSDEELQIMQERFRVAGRDGLAVGKVRALTNFNAPGDHTWSE